MFTARTGDPQRIVNENKDARRLVFLLPYVEEQALNNRWDYDLPANQNPGRSTKLAIFKCPSNGFNSGNSCSVAGAGWPRGIFGRNGAHCGHHMQSPEHGVPGPLVGIGKVTPSVSIRTVTAESSQTVAVEELRTGLNAETFAAAGPCRDSPPVRVLSRCRSPQFARRAYRPSDDFDNCRTAGWEGDHSPGMGVLRSGKDPSDGSPQPAFGGVQAVTVDRSVRFAADSVQGNPTHSSVPAHGVGQAVHRHPVHERAGRETVAAHSNFKRLYRCCGSLSAGGRGWLRWPGTERSLVRRCSSWGSSGWSSSAQKPRCTHSQNALTVKPIAV